MKIGQFSSLRLKKEKAELNKNGSFWRSKSFNIKFAYESNNKVMFIIKKKVGNSPVRNKIKRQIRSILIERKPSDIKIHIIFVIKSEYLQQSFLQIKKEVNICLDKIISSHNK